jgi:phage shock protein A
MSPQHHNHLNPMQVESEILRLSNLLEERVSDFQTAITRAAEAEARFKYLYARAMLDGFEQFPGRAHTVAEREARVEVECADAHAAYLITDATAKSVREALTALRSQIDALRTLAANQRSMMAP